VQKTWIRELLEEVSHGRVSVDDGVERLARLPTEDLGHAQVDTHRELRCGFSEVVFGAGKHPAELVSIARSILCESNRLLVTRVSEESATTLATELPGACVHARARAVTVGLPAVDTGTGLVAIVSAGSSDAPVALEAEITARMLGAHTRLVTDVGVAGIHRVLSRVEELRAARVIVVIAGMEGALPSVVGGLVERPVIAVPTSIGYGASFGGLAALLGMLNSCAAGVTVVNIDNGFGAGFAAAKINALGNEDG